MKTTIIVSLIMPVLLWAHPRHPESELRACYLRYPLVFWSLMMSPDQELKLFKQPEVRGAESARDFEECTQALVQSAESREDRDYVVRRLGQVFGISEPLTRMVRANPLSDIK